jgi:hypothetical protein
MSQSIKDFEKTFIAAADLSSSKYCIVKLDTNGKAAIATLATDNIIGVLQNKPKAGEAAIVRFLGTTKVQASTGITLGAFVTATAAGQGVTTTTDKANIIGRALETATAQNDLIEVLLALSTLSI